MDLSRAVLKYRLSGVADSFVNVPGAAEPLAVAFQHGALHLWAMVQRGAPGRLYVSLRSTGQELGAADLGQFVGTIILLEAGERVVHIWARFEAKELSEGESGEVVS